MAKQNVLHSKKTVKIITNSLSNKFKNMGVAKVFTVKNVIIMEIA